MKIQYQSENLIILESALFRTTTTLIVDPEYLLLVDPNWLPIEIEYIEKLVEQHGAGKTKYLLFTHSDYDHIIGYGPFKHFRTIASANFVANPKVADILKEIATFDDEYYIQRSYAIEYPEINLVIEGHGISKQLGADQYRFYQARGHNADGLITVNESKGIVIAGDYLSNVEFPYLYDSLQKYEATLSTFESIFESQHIKILVPGHGDCTSDSQEMKHRIAESRQYLEAVKKSIKTGAAFDLKSLYERYDFPIIMNQFHTANLKLIQAEWELN